MRKAVPPVASSVFTAIVLALPGSAVVAEAQIPSSSNVFYACVRVDRDQDEGKLVRLVAESEQCGRHEQRVKWNVQGPEGPQGSQGPQGPVGPAGDTGPAGPSAAFKQVLLQSFAATATAASAGSISFTVPSGGTALVMSTGLCTLAAPMAMAFELGGQITSTNPALGTVFQNQSWISTAPGEQPAYRSVALSRTFALPSAGTYQVFLNEQRVSGTGGATCFMQLSTFFTATTLQ